MAEGIERTSQDLTEQARTLFTLDRYATATTGVEIVSAGEHTAVCQLQVGDRHLNAAGIVMGGALFTLADMAFSVAANTQILAEGGQGLWLSLDSQIRFLRAGKKERLTATARCIKSGRTTCLYNVDITNEQNILIATIQSTGIRTI